MNFQKRNTEKKEGNAENEKMNEIQGCLGFSLSLTFLFLFFHASSIHSHSFLSFLFFPSLSLLIIKRFFPLLLSQTNDRNGKNAEKIIQGKSSHERNSSCASEKGRGEGGKSRFIYLFFFFLRSFQESDRK